MATLQFTEGAGVPEPWTERKQLLNHIVDGLAQACPYGIWAEIPTSSTDYDVGFRRVTYRELSNAVNGAAWWLTDSLGQGENFETLAYIGLWDIRYVVLLLAAVKAGYKMVFPSPKYSLIGLESLLGELDVKAFLTIPSSPPVVTAFLKAHPIPVFSVPTVADLLGTQYPHFPFNKTFSTSRREPLVSLHTSGTTSHPKPIIWTHDFAASFVQHFQCLPPSGYESMNKLFQGNRIAVVMPPFHAGNLFGNLLISISCQTTVIYPLPDAAVSAETLVQILQHTTADVAVASPNVIKQMGLDSTMRQTVSTKLHALGYAGGDISRSIGDSIAEGLTLFCVYASTENSITPTIRRLDTFAANNWKRIKPHPQSGTTFRHLTNDEYEAVIVRDPIEEQEQPVFKIFPHLSEWPTKDVFTPDPLEQGSWIYRGRTDDLINFIDGVTFNPLEFEQQVGNHPEIQAALMFGANRPSAALLVELEDRPDGSHELSSITLERLWPTIDKANDLCMAQAVIEKARVVFTKPEHPLPRAGKGTVQRAKAFELYKADLDALYT